jgi:hypothetical protein
MDFAVNETGVGSNGSELHLAGPAVVQVTVQAAAYLEPVPKTKVRELPYDKEPYWDIERARIGDTRTVPVEVVLNGRPVARKNLLADGSLQTLRFALPVEESGWMALRILPSSHTNPVFLTVGQRRMRPSRESAAWCLAAVDQCWSQKASQISPSELPAAQEAYDHARQAYKKLAS